MKFRSSTSILLVILILGGAIRVHRLGSMSYANDELSAIVRTGQPDFRGLIEAAVKPDGHPAGVEVWLYYYTKVFGTSELAVRLPFALCGIAAIWLVFLLGRKWFSETSGLLAASAMAFLQFPIIHSQLARPYMPGVLWVLCSAWFLTKLVNSEKRNVGVLAGWGIATVLALYTHYFSALAVLIIGVAGLFLVKRPKLKLYLITSVACAVAFIPHIKITVGQLRMSGLDWLPPPSHEFPVDHFFYIFNESSLLFTGILTLLVTSLWLFREKLQWQKWRTLSLVLFAVPICIGMIWSLSLKPVIQNNVLIFTMPFALLWLFSFFARDFKQLWLTVGAFSLVCLYSLTVEKQFFKEPHTHPFRELTAVSASWLDEVGEGNVLAIANTNSDKYLNFYLQRHGYELEFPLFKCCDYQPLSLLDSVVRSSNKSCVLLISPGDDLPASVEPAILSKYPLIAREEVIRSGRSTLYGMIPEAHLMSLHAVKDSTLIAYESDEFLGLGTFKDIDVKAHSFRLYVTLRSMGIPVASELAVSLERDGEVTMWKAVAISRYLKSPSSKTRIVVTGGLPDNFRSNDILKAFLWNHDRQVFWVDDVEFVVF